MKTVVKLMLVNIVFFSSLFALNPTTDTIGVISFELFDENKLHVERKNEGILKDLNVSFFLFKTLDSNITIKNISSHQSEFMPFESNEKFQNEKLNYWLKVRIENLPFGGYIASYGDMMVLEESFSPKQRAEHFVVGKTNRIAFSYDKQRDSSVYYFKLSTAKYANPYRFVYLNSKKSFYAEIDNQVIVLLVLGIIIGFLLMAGLYNGAMYYFNRDISFLYYMLMQFSLSLVLLNMIGILNFTDLAIARSELYYTLVSLVAIFFSTRFTQTFLNSKEYTAKLHILLNVVIILLVIDGIVSIFYHSIIFSYHLLPLFTLFYIMVGVVRVKQGFNPAIFYLLGWSVLAVSIFVDSFWQMDFLVSPIFIGTAIEAMFFSLALSYKIKMIADEKEQQKEMLVHQSKLASMGEMIGNIAHQWRQPLTHLSYTVMNIEDAFKHKELSEKYLDKKVKEANFQIAFMSQTIDDFRDFYVLNKPKELFSLELETQESLKIMSHALEEKGIEVLLTVKEDLEIYSHKNEYKQVLLNLLSNAKDALVERAVENPKIVLTVDKNEVRVADNAGGIEAKIMGKIFEPYFTSKEGNSGIGLYMAKMILERSMGAKLSVRNENSGALFTLNFKP